MADKRKYSLMPFDTRVWLSDPRINTLSLMAKGVWVTMLCYMWESSQRGMLVKPNNTPYTLNELVVLLGLTDDEPLQELIDCGVLPLNHKGVYYSADMVKQADISEKRRNAGKKGGDAMKQRLTENDKAPFTEKENDVVPPTPKEPPPKHTQQEQPLLFSNDTGSENVPPPLTEKQKQLIEKKRKYHYAECVTLTRDEYAKLCAEHTEDGAKRMIEMLDNYKGSKGKRYKSDYKAILNWVVDKYNEEYLRYGTQRQTNSIAPNTGRGIENNTRYASGALPLDQTAVGGSDSTTQEGYSERF